MLGHKWSVLGEVRRPVFSAPCGNPFPRVTFTGSSILIHPVPSLTGRAGEGALSVEAQARGAGGPAGTLVDI